MSAAHWSNGKPALALDPYLDWAIQTAWAGHLEALDESEAVLWVPLLGPCSAAWQALLEDPQVWHSPLTPEGARYATLWCRADDAGRVAKAWPGCEMSQPLPLQPAARARGPEDEVAWVPRRQPLLLAAIDQGGAPLHSAFFRARQPLQTRLLAYWDQSESPGRRPHWQASAAGYGRELGANRLQALCEAAGASPERERLLYEELGLDEVLRAEMQGRPEHATFVLDTLAGRPDLQDLAASARPGVADAASDAPLVLVSVPSARPGQTSGAATVAQVLDALHYILDQARRHAPEATVVVNVSLGMLAGPHDGSSLIERAIDALMEDQPHLLVVIAAGNNGADLLVDPGLGTNARAELRPGEAARLSWRLQPEDPTDSFLEFWWQGEDLDGLELCVLEPFASGGLRLGQSQDLRHGGRLLARWLLQAGSKEGQGRGQLSLAPVAGARGGLPGGCWTLGLRNVGPSTLRVDARVQGDLPRWDLPEPVQSVLADAEGLVLGGAGSLNGLATGHWPLVVLAAFLDDGRDTPFSSKPLHARQHVAHAVAEEGVLAGGLVASGATTGSLVRMGGTSVAAPVAARIWANKLVHLPPPSRPSGWPKLVGLEAGAVADDAVAKGRRMPREPLQPQRAPD